MLFSEFIRNSCQKQETILMSNLTERTLIAKEEDEKKLVVSARRLSVGANLSRFQTEWAARRAFTRCQGKS